MSSNYLMGGLSNRLVVKMDYHKPSFDATSNQSFSGIEKIESPSNSVINRIIGSIKMDLSVILKIKDTPRLQSEARKVLFMCLSLVSLIQLLAIFNLPARYEIKSVPGTISRVLIDRFAGAFIFLFLLSWISRNLTLDNQIVSTNKCIRVLSYAYVLIVVQQIVFFIGEYTKILEIQYLLMIVFFYTIIVFLFLIKQITESSYYVTAITIAISLIGVVAFQLILNSIVNFVFGGSYEQ